MEKILIKILRDEVSYGLEKRGKRASPFGKRVNAGITLPSQIKKRAMEIARQRKMSLSRMFELWLLDQDRIYRKALLTVLKADETLNRSWDRGKTPLSSLGQDDLSEALRSTVETKKMVVDPYSSSQSNAGQVDESLAHQKNNPEQPCTEDLSEASESGPSRSL